MGDSDVGSGKHRVKDSQLTEIARYLTREEAEITRGMLASYGYNTFVMADDAGGLRPFMSYGNGVRLMAPMAIASEAAKLLPAESKNAKTEQALRPSSWDLEEKSNRMKKIAIIGLVVPLLPQVSSSFLALQMLGHMESLNRKQKSRIIEVLSLNILVISFWIVFFRHGI